MRYIVIHDTDVDYSGTVRAFMDPGHCCAANYVVDGEDSPPSSYPAVTQFVPKHDVAYHAGNSWYNQHSLGVEHVGFADRPRGYYTERLYDTSADLVAYLAAVYAIPIDRAHIIAHGDVPALIQDDIHSMHWDPMRPRRPPAPGPWMRTPTCEPGLRMGRPTCGCARRWWAV